MSQYIMSAADAAKKISEGSLLLLAGDESVLRKLPKGNWIGGTIPYFMSAQHGAIASREMVFVTDVTDLAEKWEIATYDESNLAQIYTKAPANGFSFILIPALSRTHLSFALNAPSYKNFGHTPLVGWITGVHLSDMGRLTPKVFNGSTGAASENEALVLAVTLPADKVAELGIVNLFEQGDGDTLIFPQPGFSAQDVLVNGEPRNLAEYIKEKGLDTKLPLVADYYGTSINISFQSVDNEKGIVSFYAPVFRNINYKHARPVADYIKAFEARLATERNIAAERLVFSCNCILNYLYSELEGKKTDPLQGPITFGELAYQLLNQTLVYLEVHSV